MGNACGHRCLAAALGLERYEQAFQEAEIDAEVLPELTDADLKELGIPLGPRKKLLKAMAVLGGGAEVLPARQAKPPEAERRQLTVCSATWWGRPRSRPDSTPRTCAR